jgi:long-chain acyl-CoA synthetase
VLGCDSAGDVRSRRNERLGTMTAVPKWWLEILMNRRPWLAEYPAGVPHEVDCSAYPSVVALMDESFVRHRDASAYRLGPAALSFGDLDRCSLAFATFLQGRGLVRNDRVAIMLPNLLQYPVAAAGVLRAGLIAVNVNPLYTPRELEHQLRDSGARALVIFAPIFAGMGESLQSMLTSLGIDTVVLASPGDRVSLGEQPLAPAGAQGGRFGFDAALAQGALGELRRPVLDPEDIAVLQYTGGTTGVSKGASLSHRALVANVLSAGAWLQAGWKRRPAAGQMNIVCALPLYHVFAFTSCALLGMRIGAQNILIPNARDLGQTLALLRPHKLHIFPAVNTLFNGLASHPDFGSLDFSELSVSVGGGTAVMPAVAERWLALTGCAIIEGYGLSETTAAVTCNRADSETFTGTVGLPFPGTDLRIVDDEGQEVASGQPGEIVVKAPQLMSGYWGRPEESVASLTADGFFKTGDIGTMDERGYLRIVDRKKDMVLVSGFNVYPSEIEAVVSSHPAVLECAVIGVPDDHTGEAVQLFVVARDPALSVADLRAFCETQLTGYKRPKLIELRAELPKSPVGKVLRRELRNGGLGRSANGAQ